MSKSEDGSTKFKRLFWDIETSYNVVRTWTVGYNVSITHNDIIKERAIICICYKWEGEKKVYSLEWNKGDDKQLLIDFVKILNSADEIIGHNSDRYDERFVRTRCIYHRIPLPPSYQTLDTLKLSKSGFRFNSNRLDYIGKYLGVGGKMDTGGFKLWQDIVEKNDPKAMKKMVKYCKRDVQILENVFKTMNPYTKSKTHVGVRMGNNKCSCPNCGSKRTEINQTMASASGILKKKLRCKDCGKYFTITNTEYLKLTSSNK